MGNKLIHIGFVFANFIYKIRRSFTYLLFTCVYGIPGPKHCCTNKPLSGDKTGFVFWQGVAHVIQVTPLTVCSDRLLLSSGSTACSWSSWYLQENKENIIKIYYDIGCSKEFSVF